MTELLTYADSYTRHQLFYPRSGALAAEHLGTVNATHQLTILTVQVVSTDLLFMSELQTFFLFHCYVTVIMQPPSRNSFHATTITWPTLPHHEYNCFRFFFF